MRRGRSGLTFRWERRIEIEAKLTPGTQLWTLDKRLKAAASQFDLAFSRTH